MLARLALAPQGMLSGDLFALVSSRRRRTKIFALDGLEAVAGRVGLAERPVRLRSRGRRFEQWTYTRGMINVSETAASKISELLVEEQKSGGGLRVYVQGGGCSGFQYGMMIEENGQGTGDQVFESHGIKLFIDPISIQYLKNAEVDFVETVTGGGFTIKNPNATSTCGCGSSFSTD